MRTKHVRLPKEERRGYGIPFEETEKKLMSDPEYARKYNLYKKRMSFQRELKKMRRESGLSNDEIAEQIGVNTEEILKLEESIDDISGSTLISFILACGGDITRVYEKS